MEISFEALKREDLNEAVELTTRAYENYEYFTIFFPNADECRKAIRSIIDRAWRTVLSRTNFFAAKVNGKIVGVAQLDAPHYERPPVFVYVLHGWFLVYLSAKIKHINDWVTMDEASGKPCHDYQKSGEGIWYCNTITVEPSFQGKGVGTKLIEFMGQYARERGGKQLVLFTNSEKNLAFYKNRGFEVFDEREIHHDGKKIGSWSVKKSL
ncbi:MAG: GNAT family N-acetyltransferase [Fibrobacter sp.]|nr:GNAT family N-acetyltransferase [Fibrobacter sp.]